MTKAHLKVVQDAKNTLTKVKDEINETMENTTNEDKADDLQGEIDYLETAIDELGNIDEVV